MNTQIRNIFGMFALAVMLSACNTHTVKSTTYTPVIQDNGSTPEDFLLDVGVMVFDPGIDEIEKGDEETTNDQIRLAESRYAAYMLSETLQRSGNWGIVRVLPTTDSPMDVVLKGVVLQSDGEAMRLRITARDSTGVEWYTREYHEVISQFSYDPGQLKLSDPFQVIYNTIANDLLNFRKENLQNGRITEIRTVSEMLFAQRFAPQAFDSYISTNRNGTYQLTRLPSANDPLMNRVNDIRERDFMYIDTVQDYYDTYTRQMRLPYDSWREQSYHATIELRALRESAKRRFIAGTAVVLGGIAAATSGGDWYVQDGGAVAVGAGAYLIKSGFDKQAEARIHIAALEELGQSLENAVAPRVINLEDQTITLTGTVEEQYSQWKEILADLYASELGGL
jgi:hypothetical protein